ncbi:unnamed protein product, partial [Brassica napus]
FATWRPGGEWSFQCRDNFLVALVECSPLLLQVMNLLIQCFLPSHPVFLRRMFVLSVSSAFDDIAILCR